MRDIIIIGSGPAGFTAAIYAARAELKPLLIASSVEIGGELMNTTEVENFPGFPEGIMGPDLMAKLQAQAERFGTEVVYDDVVVARPRRPRQAREARQRRDARGRVAHLRDRLGVPQARPARGGDPLGSRPLVVRHLRRLLLPAEDDRGRRRRRLGAWRRRRSSPASPTRSTSSTAATRSGRRRSCSSAPSTTRRSSSSGTPRSPRSTATTAVTGVTLRDTVTGDERGLDLDGLFVAIGNDPRTHLVHGKLDLTPEGTIAVEGRTLEDQHPRRLRRRRRRSTRTYRQAVTAAGSGTVAALDAEHYLAALRNARRRARRRSSRDGRIASPSRTDRRVDPTSDIRLPRKGETQ